MFALAARLSRYSIVVRGLRAMCVRPVGVTTCPFSNSCGRPYALRTSPLCRMDAHFIRDRARMLAQATKTGPAVAAFCEMVMADRPHPEQGFRTCLGVLALVKTYGPERVDAACQRGVTIRARTVTSIRSILKTGPRKLGLDRAFLEGSEEASPLQHANIRGGGYYH